MVYGPPIEYGRATLLYKKQLQNEAHWSNFTAVFYSHRVHAPLILHASFASLHWYLSCILPLLLGEPLWVKHPLSDLTWFSSCLLSTVHVR
jgi:hypothetical protein